MALAVLSAACARQRDRARWASEARRLLPPVLPRRMWAGGRLRWEPANPLCVGQQVQRRSSIRSVKHKAGRSGELLFVLVEHQYRNARGLALTEEHDIVYRRLRHGSARRAAPASGRRPVAARGRPAPQQSRRWLARPPGRAPSADACCCSATRR
jgi:hydroxyacyl-ACP dehydratase HTD2-like protein with hotdog domain